MNDSPAFQQSLSQLIMLREREVERHQAQLAEKEQLRTRYVNTMARLDELNNQVGPTGQAQPCQASNNADYKQAVLHWAEQQRQALARHEAEMAVQRQAMLVVARKQEAYIQLLQRTEARVRSQRQRGEQKLQDDMAGQVWLRRST